MRASVDVCGCFPTGRHYPGIADRLRVLARVVGLARGFAPDTAWARASFAVIDFETTGLDPEVDRILEIGIAAFENGELVLSKNWLVNPTIPVPKESSDVHGITDEMLKDAPRFHEVAHELREALAGRIPVAYNHGFDSRFLWAELRRAGLPTRGDDVPPAWSDDGVWIDPLVWAREIQKAEKGFKLVDVAARLGVPLETAHRAAFDAEATGRVLLALAAAMPEQYGDVLRVQPRYAATQDVENAGWRRG
ncbi:MAG: 3'-5' exonuclease [Sandaracinus sp.]